jgi:hypothetical protein
VKDRCVVRRTSYVIRERLKFHEPISITDCHVLDQQREWLSFRGVAVLRSRYEYESEYELTSTIRTRPTILHCGEFGTSLEQSRSQSTTMANLSFLSLLLLASAADAFLQPTLARVGATPLFQSTETAKSTTGGGISGELGTPCEDDCAMTSFPNLPESVHPGVLSGQPMMDLLNHAKENGTSHILIPTRYIDRRGSTAGRYLGAAIALAAR